MEERSSKNLEFAFKKNFNIKDLSQIYVESERWFYRDNLSTFLIFFFFF